MCVDVCVSVSVSVSVDMCVSVSVSVCVDIKCVCVCVCDSAPCNQVLEADLYGGARVRRGTLLFALCVAWRANQQGDGARGVRHPHLRRRLLAGSRGLEVSRGEGIPPFRCL